MWLIYIRNAVLMCILLCAAYVDLKSRIIPNRLVFIVFFYGFLEVGHTLATMRDTPYEMRQTLMMKVFGFLTALLICVISRFVSRDGLGMGDVKLLVALGFAMGFQSFLQMLLFTSLCASVITLGLLMARWIERDGMLPFAPYISIGMGLMTLFDFFGR